MSYYLTYNDLFVVINLIVGIATLCIAYCSYKKKK